MTERVKNIVDRIRIDLSDVNKEKISPANLYSVINRIQNEILSETHCLQKIISVTTEKGLADYDIAGENCILFLHATLEPDGEPIGSDYELKPLDPNLKIVTFDKFNYFRTQSYGQPYQVAFFNQKVHLMPIPDAVYNLKLYGVQIRATDKIDDVNDPILPSYVDECIIDGVKAYFNKDFLPDYLNSKKQINSNAHFTGASFTPSADWLD